MVTAILLPPYLIIVGQYPTESLDIVLSDLATEIRCCIWVNVEGGLVVLLPLDLEGGQLNTTTRLAAFCFCEFLHQNLQNEGWVVNNQTSVCDV